MRASPSFHLRPSPSLPQFAAPPISSPLASSPSTPNFQGHTKRKSVLLNFKAFFNRKSKSTTMGASIGLWRCCKCGKDHELYQHEQGQHLTNTLDCKCPHRSCENCTLSGDIKPYKPVQEPIPVHFSDTHKRILFGIFCSDCGLSWQARPISDIVGTQSVRQKVSAVPKTLAQHGHPLEKLRASRSMTNLFGEPSSKALALKAAKSTYNLRVLSDEMEKEHGEQADSVMVMFSGFECTCGRTLDSFDLCFQIVEQPEKKDVDAKAINEPVMNAKVTSVKVPDAKVTDAKIIGHKEPTFFATPEDIARGIHKPMITLNGGQGRTVRHPNPLRSNPVTDEELARLYGN